MPNPLLSAFVSGGVRRPISLKIFGIAAVLLAMMIAVTVLSTVNLRRLGDQLDFLSQFYIRMDQLMGDVRARGLGELILIERIIEDKPKIGFKRAREAAESHRAEIKACDSDSVRSAIGKIRETQLECVDQHLVTYELLKLCAKDDLAEADGLIALALANDAMKVDPQQAEVVAQLRSELRDIPSARAKLHATFEGYVDEVRSGTKKPGEARVLAVIRSQLEDDRAEVTKQISEVTRLVHSATRDSAAAALRMEQKVRVLGWIITMAACALGILIAGYITRSLVKPVHDLLTGTKAVQ